MTTKQNDILISFIVCGRNDDYGGHLIQRISCFVSSVAILSAKYNINSEIVFVEWNPPEDRPPLWLEIYNMNIAIRQYNQKVKFIIVPNSIHKNYKNKERPLPLFECLAKNVGIRRAEGKFILLCNPDLIFTEIFFQKLQNGFFTDKYIYRSVRIDVSKYFGKIPETYDEYQNLVMYCKNHNIHTHLYDNMKPIKDRILSNAPFTGAPGDFMLMARENWFTIKGCPEITTVFSHLDSITLYKAVEYYEQWVLDLDSCIYHQDHDRIHVDPNEQFSIIKYPNDNNWGLNNIILNTVTFN